MHTTFLIGTSFENGQLKNKSKVMEYELIRIRIHEDILRLRPMGQSGYFMYQLVKH
jgi:hypothetical protein